MKFKRVKFPMLAMMLFTLIIFISCKSTKITLTVTKCDVDDITITETTRVTVQPGSQWTLVTVITVKCAGEVVEDAELKAEFWWPNGEFKRKTNDQGQIRISKRGDGDRPTGKAFIITVKGNDGEKPMTFTIQ